MADLTLTAHKREVTGKAVAKLRRDGQLPAVVYGHDIKTEPLVLDAKTTEKVYAQAGSSRLVLLQIGEGKPRNVLFHQVQIEPKRGHLLHADLYVVRMDEELQTEVPLHFTGESTAVYQDEGTLVRNLETVEVACLPGDLPESIEIDISVLDDFEKTITLADLTLPKGVRLVAEEPDTVLVAKIEPPRSEEEMADLDAPIDEAAELPEEVKEEDPVVVAEENEGDKDRRDKK